MDEAMEGDRPLAEDTFGETNGDEVDGDEEEEEEIGEDVTSLLRSTVQVRYARAVT